MVGLLAVAAILFLAHWLPTARDHYSLAQVVQAGPARPQYDFWQYYAAGHNWIRGDDPYRSSPSRSGTIPIPRSTRVSGYIYPPAALPFFGLLSRLTYERARAVWLALSLGALVTPLVIGVALARGRRWETVALGALLLAASDPVLFHIRQGQIDMIVAGLTISGFLLHGRLRSWPTAFLFAVAILLKLTPVVVLLALVAYRRDWRVLVKTAVVGVALTAATLFAVDPRLYGEYAGTVLPAASGGNPFFHNQSLLRGWSHLDRWAKFAGLTGYALVVFAAAVAGRGRAAGAGRHGAAATAPGLTSESAQLLLLAVCGVLLFSPLSWRMAFVWAVVPLALALAASPWRGTRLQYALVAAGGILMCLPVWDAPVLDSLETMGAVVAGTGALAALLTARSPRAVTEAA